MPVSILPSWRLKGRSLLPAVQGGMGVGVSAHPLAGHVAALGALGTIASVELRHHHADLVAATTGTRDRDAIDAANLTALDREIRGALPLSGGRCAIASTSCAR
jgi:nitronate monooxygenase